MKSNLLTVIACAATLGLSAQGFFTKTCYRGAFAPSPNPMWTDTWTEWDPQNKMYPAPTLTVIVSPAFKDNEVLFNTCPPPPPCPQ